MCVCFVCMCFLLGFDIESRSPAGIVFFLGIFTRLFSFCMLVSSFHAIFSLLSRSLPPPPPTFFFSWIIYIYKYAELGLCEFVSSFNFFCLFRAPFRTRRSRAWSRGRRKDRHRTGFSIR